MVFLLWGPMQPPPLWKPTGGKYLGHSSFKEVHVLFCFQDILYRQLQAGKYAKCTFAFKKKDSSVAHFDGHINAYQSDEQIVVNASFANTMCTLATQDSTTQGNSHYIFKTKTI